MVDVEDRCTRCLGRCYKKVIEPKQDTATCPSLLPRPSLNLLETQHSVMNFGLSLYGD